MFRQTKSSIVFVLFLATNAAFCSDLFGDTRQTAAKFGPYCSGLTASPTMNAAGLCLKGSDFVGQNFSQAVFDGCDLDGVIFEECDLSKASFRSASLRNCKFESCNTDGADFHDAIVNEVVGLRLVLNPDQLKSTKSYRTKDLSNCLIRVSKIPPQIGSDNAAVAFDFSNTNFSGSQLEGDFSACNLRNASFGTTRITNCIISSDQWSELSGNLGRHRRFAGLEIEMLPSPLRFPACRYEECSFWWPVDEVDFTGVTFDHCTFRHGIKWEQLASTRSFSIGDLTGNTFYECRFGGANFRGQNLTGCRFYGCDLREAKFDDAVISRCVFFDRTGGERKNRGLTIDQIRSTWNFRNGHLDEIELPPELTGDGDKSK